MELYTQQQINDLKRQHRELLSVNMKLGDIEKAQEQVSGEGIQEAPSDDKLGEMIRRFLMDKPKNISEYLDED